MSSYDGVKVCELVDLFILNHQGEKFGKENIGLYKDDGLAILKNELTLFITKHFTKCGEEESYKKKHINGGVPQGSKIEPVSFVVHINNLPEAIK